MNILMLMTATALTLAPGPQTSQGQTSQVQAGQASPTRSPTHAAVLAPAHVEESCLNVTTIWFGLGEEAGPVTVESGTCPEASH